MIKKYTLLASALFISALGFGQQAQHWCNSLEAMEKVFQQDPAARARMQQLDAQAEADDASRAANKNAGSNTTQATVKIIPVVFHVLHLGGNENISDAQIMDQMAILNRDYQKQNADTASVISQFSNNIGKVNFEFRLAHKTPTGACTNGINRYYDARTDWNGTNQTSNAAYYNLTWDPTKYLNVYVVRKMQSGAAGYTYRPGSFTSGSKVDAIYILHTYVGSIGTGNLNQSRALTHEVGHWFNLQHTWGSTNQPGVSCGNDAISDTPLTKGHTNCTLTDAVCTAGVVENVQNYMEYAYCSNMFTNGQVTAMNASANSSTSGRNNLSSTNNVAATGIADPYVVSNFNSACSPLANFKATKTIICAGTSQNFYDLTTVGQPTSWSWTFQGGTPSTSTLQNPTNILYSTPGTYSVSLVSTNANGSNTKSQATYMVVNDTTPNYVAYFVDNFETHTTVNSPDWSSSSSQGSSAWALSSTASYTGGSKSAYFNIFSNNLVNDTNYLYMPRVKVPTTGNQYLKFKVAHAPYNATSGDRLQIHISSDCGSTWVLRYNKVTNSTSTTTRLNSITTNKTTAWTPTAATDWRKDSISLSSFTAAKSVMVRFALLPDTLAGNNLFIDDVNFGLAPLGVNDNQITNNHLEVYPNPNNGTATISFKLKETQPIAIKVFDLTGKVVEVIENKELPEGEYDYKTGVKVNYAPGIYFVELKTNNAKAVRKIVVE